MFNDYFEITVTHLANFDVHPNLMEYLNSYIYLYLELCDFELLKSLAKD